MEIERKSEIIHRKVGEETLSTYLRSHVEDRLTSTVSKVGCGFGKFRSDFSQTSSGQ